MTDVTDVPPVEADETLWRRLFPDWIVPSSDGSERVSSAAFKDRHTGEVSVHRARYTTVESVLSRNPRQPYAAELLARVPMSLGLAVEPRTEDGPDHAVIVRPTEGNAKQLARSSRIVGRSAA